jgi:hypothetical protein
MSTSTHRHVYYTRSPNVHGTRIKFFIRVLFRRNVRCRATQPSRQMRLLFPRHAETLAISKIRDLETSILRKEEILRFQVAVRNTHFVHVVYATHELFEVAICFEDFEFAGCEDESVQVAACTVFHDFAVVAFGVLEQVEGVDDVRVAEGGGNTEFGGETFGVLLDGFLRTATEFFDRVELFDGGISGIGLVGYSYYSKGTCC